MTLHREPAGRRAQSQTGERIWRTGSGQPRSPREEQRATSTGRWPPRLRHARQARRRAGAHALRAASASCSSWPACMMADPRDRSCSTSRRPASTRASLETIIVADRRAQPRRRRLPHHRAQHGPGGAALPRTSSSWPAAASCCRGHAGRSGPAIPRVIEAYLGGRRHERGAAARSRRAGRRLRARRADRARRQHRRRAPARSSRSSGPTAPASRR